MATSACSSTSLPRIIAGSTPGLLDPTQPTRLHRVPGSFLHFASFHPLTANTEHDAYGNPVVSRDNSCQPRRIVIETGPDGTSTWRFVPNARREHAVPDEGVWPRMIYIAEQPIICSIDQWDIYKLDPAYDCFVPAPPSAPVITPIQLRPPPSSGSSHPTSPSPSSSTIPPSSSFHKPQTRRARSVTPARSFKRLRGPPPELFDVEDDEDDVDANEEIGMELDGKRPVDGRAKRSRAEMEEKRRLRREKTRARSRQPSQEPSSFTKSHPVQPDHDGTTAPPTETLPSQGVKRKEPYYSYSPPRDDRSEVTYIPGAVSSHKRARTMSPEAIRRDLASIKLARRSKLEETRHKAMEAKRATRDQVFVERVFAEVLQPGSATTDPPAGSTRDDQKEPPQGLHDIDEEESEEIDPHLAAIAESRRKLAELEADRPLWEQAAREREQRESAERAERASRKLARERAEASRLAAEAEAAAREQARAAQAEREAAARRNAQRRERIAASRQTFMHPGPWTPQRALERYNTLSESFDNAKFTNEEPLLFDLVPWPVLHAPDVLRVEDVDWAAVEAFFRAVRPYMSDPLRGIAEYKTFVQKAQRRFHPDRWSARRLTHTILDESERDCMTAALNTVSQAITSLWSELKES